MKTLSSLLEEHKDIRFVNMFFNFKGEKIS